MISSAIKLAAAGVGTVTQPDEKDVVPPVTVASAHAQQTDGESPDAQASSPSPRTDALTGG